MAWEILPSLPEPNGGFICAEYRGQVLVIGGSRWADGEKLWLKGIQVFDPGTGRWHAAPTLTEPLAHAVTGKTARGLVIGGGTTGKRLAREMILIEEWPIVTRNLWPLDQAAVAAAGGVVGNEIIFVGGVDDVSDFSGLRKRAFACDLESGRQRELPDYPGPPMGVAASVVAGGEVFVFGGASRDPVDQTINNLAEAYAFSPVKNRWRKLRPLPYAVRAMSAVALDEDRIYLAGGYRSSPDEFSDKGFVYHIKEDRYFPALDLPYPTLAGLVRCGDFIYCLGGEDRAASRTDRAFRIPASELERRVVLPGTDFEIRTYGSGNAILPTNICCPGSAPHFARCQHRSPRETWPALCPLPAEILTCMTLSVLDWVLMACYLAGMVGVGLYFSTRQTSTLEFFLGGKRFGAVATGLSILATGFSAISFLGAPAYVIAHDWGTFLASMTGIPAALITAWIFVPFYHRLNVTSSYEYLEHRFDTKVATLGGVLFFLMRGLLAGIAIYAPSIALCAVTGWNLNACIMISGIATIFYTAFGGMSAVVWTDVMQVIVMFGGAIIIVIQLTTQIPGSASDWLSQAGQAGKFNIFNFDFSWTKLTFWGACFGGLFYSVAFFGVDQVLVQRYLSVRSPAEGRKALLLSAILMLPTNLTFFCIGTLLFLFMSHHPDYVPAGTPVEQIFPTYIVRELPPGVAGILVAAIYAAAMSTLSSVLNSLATVTINDFYKRFRRQVRSEEYYVRKARQLTTLWGVLAVLVALLAPYLDQNVWMGAVKVSSLFMGPMLGLFLLGMFVSRVNARTALYGCMGGLILAVAGGLGTRLDIFWITFFGTMATLILGISASLIQPATRIERAASGPYLWAGVKKNSQSQRSGTP